MSEITQFEGYRGILDQRTIEVERALASIEAEAGPFTLDQRIGITWALHDLADNVRHGWREEW